MTRIYANCKEAINEIERDIMEMGIRVHPKTMQNKNVEGNEDYSTMEVQNYSFTIIDSYDKDTIVSALNWCHAEFDERINKSDNPGEAWKLRKEVWEPFIVQGKFDYTYSERMNRLGQIGSVILELRDNPDSRQCIIHIHAVKDTSVMQVSRVPCSMYYQLMVRRGKLDIIYNMRSSDFDTHFCNDIWLACELRDYIAREVGIEPGIFHMNIGSLHRYKNYTTKHVF